MRLFKFESFLERIKGEFFIGEVRPKNIDFSVTDFCNSKCVYCRAWTVKPKKEISIDEIKKAFDSPWWNTIKQITITGGEPTLREDIVEIFKYFSERFPNAALRLNSNCINYKRVCDVLNQIKKMGIEDFVICISIDGREEIHDKLRGVNGSFDSCIKVIKYCEKNHIMWGASTTVTQYNYKELPFILDICKKYKYCIGMCLRFAMTAEKFFYNSYMNFVVTREMIDFVKEFNKRIPPEKNIAPFFIENMCKYYETNGKKRIKCRAAGRTYLFINPQGEVFSCFIRPKKMGNILNLPRVWKSKRNTKIREECINCKYFPCFTEGPVLSSYSLTFFWWFSYLLRNLSFRKILRRRIYIKKLIRGNSNECECCYNC